MGQLLEAGLKGKPRKCQIFPESIQYFGHVVCKRIIAADQYKLDRIREWRVPTTGTEMASFHDLCNYYRLLISHFADDEVALYKLTSELRVVPTPELSDAFAKWKSDLSESIALKLPNPEKPFMLETDGSSVAVGAVLKQMNGEEVSTLFSSLALNSSQRNYSSYERELLAVVKACEAFRVFLLGRHFILRTDDKTLEAIFSSATRVWSRVAKCKLALQPFDCAMEEIPAKENVLAYSLSRIPWALTLPNSDTSVDFVELVDADSESPSEVGSEISLRLVAIDTRRQHQSQETDKPKLQQWIATETVATRDELMAATPYLSTMAQRLPELCNVCSFLAL